MNMKRFNSYILIIVFICFQAFQTVLAVPASNNKAKTGSTTAWRGANRNVHHLSFWGGAGYSGLVNNYDYNRFVGGGGGLLGIGYEYRYDHFLLDVGPEFRIFSSLDKISFPSPYDVSMMWDGFSQTKHYTFSDPMKESHVVGQLMLPIMAGGRWQQIYFLGGVKIGYTLLGTYTQKGLLTTSITDDMAYDPDWVDMPNHGAVTNDPYNPPSGKLSYGLDVALSAEVGININEFLSRSWNDQNAARKYPIHMRASVFIDYGLMNLTPTCEGVIASANEQQISTRSLHSSEWASSRLNSLLVGVKFTALLQMNKPQPPKPQKPALVLDVVDKETNKGIASATVEITPLNSTAKKPRTTKKTTNGKGRMVTKLAQGNYHLSVAHSDYISNEEDYSHGDFGDTLLMELTPRPHFRFYVRDAKSDSLIAAQVTIINTTNETTIATIDVDSITGYGHLLLPLNTPFKVHIEANEHLALTENIEDIGGQRIYRLEPIIKQRTIILRNLFFATNKTTILPQSESAMQDLYNLMVENPEIRIRIIGHTDNVGSDQFNQRLSEGRANSVRNELIKRGISADRIEAEGKGMSEPIDTNNTEEGRQNNRRVEFMIL